ncbi:MAG TPA: cytochrome c biogenesis protein CcdA [Herpetosiphonaceae bacterium]|nr:cytochrome c biogenesis protein CcdA [Herpetosiphonaceae bacterium]
MTSLPFFYAFMAGMLATVNPCGFAMLPAYVSYYLGAKEPEFGERPVLQRLARSLVLGLAITAGFVLLFGAVGLVISAGGRALIRLVPWAAAGIGLVLILIGIALLFERRLHVPTVNIGVARTPGWRGIFLFGIGYAIASLSCTLPIFLVIVGSTLTTMGVLGGLVMFLGYALGMGTVLTAITIGTGLLKGAVTRGLRQVVPYVERLSAVMLILAGGYILYYWLPQLV